MNKQEKNKFIILFIFIIFIITTACISKLVQDNFSTDSIKSVINTFIPFALGGGWILYFSIKNEVSFYGDFSIKLKGSVIFVLIVAVTFTILRFLLR